MLWQPSSCLLVPCTRALNQRSRLGHLSGNVAPETELAPLAFPFAGTKSMNRLDAIALQEQEQCFLDLVWRFLDNGIDHSDFYDQFRTRWAEMREDLWLTASDVQSEQPQCRDFRPLMRFLDAIEASLRKKQGPAALPAAIRDLTNSYYKLKRRKSVDNNPCPHYPFSQPRPVNVFERPCSPGRLYPCTLNDLRRRLPCFPEQDLVGLWAVGLANPDKYEQNAWGIYYRSYWHVRGPIIFILSQPPLEGLGKEPSLRRFILDSVLPHEIGHHVQYEQRRRKRYERALPSATKEQFAEDYALRWARGRICQGNADGE